MAGKKASPADIIRQANTVLLVDGKLDRIDEFFTTDYVVHLTRSDMEGGYKTIRNILDLLAGAFPKLKVEVEILLEGKDRVAWQRTLRGRQKGAYRGFPASDKTIVWRDMVVSRLEKGRIAEDWLSTDLAEQLLLSRKK